MPLNGSGAFTPDAADFPAVSGTIIESADYNNVINDISSGLSTAIMKDGQTTVTADIPFGGKKITGLGNADAATLTDALNNTFLQSGANSTSRALIGKLRDVVSVADKTGATTKLKLEAANTDFAAAKGVVIMPAGTTAPASAPTLAEATTVFDFSGSAVPPNETTPTYTGQWISINGTSEAAISTLAAYNYRSSPSTTSSAMLGTSWYTGTLPNAATLAGATFQSGTTGAITPGTGVVSGIEGYTAIQSTGGTIADVRGMTASVNIDRSTASTNITTASSVFGGTITKTATAAGSFVVARTYTIAVVGSTDFTLIGAASNTVGLSFVASGVGSGTGTAYGHAIGFCYGVFGALQNAGTTRNFSFYSEGNFLYNHSSYLSSINLAAAVKDIIKFGSPANNQILVAGLDDSLGWQFTDQTNSVSYTWLTSAGIGFGVNPSWALHVTKEAPSDIIGRIHNTSGTTPFGLQVGFSAAAPNDATRYFMSHSDSSTLRAQIDSNGGLRNFSANNVNLSDQSVKTQIETYSDDELDALEQAFVSVDWGKYKYLDQKHDDYNYGYTAQGVAAAFAKVNPAIVDDWDTDPLSKDENRPMLKCVYGADLENIGMALLARTIKRVAALETK